MTESFNLGPAVGAGERGDTVSTQLDSFLESGLTFYLCTPVDCNA